MQPRYCFILKSPDRVWGHSASYFISSGGYFPERKANVVKLTIYFHVMPRLRNSGAIPPRLYMPKYPTHLRICRKWTDNIEADLREVRWEMGGHKLDRSGSR